jgi:catechol 2,3-dioxygenase-like lactoylglutathione lyase family enzyme
VKIELTKRVNIGTLRYEDAVKFYTDTMGLKIHTQEPDYTRFDTEQYILYVSREKFLGPVLEFKVENLDEARAELVGRGCEVVIWEGKGKRCYIKDPFGTCFNLCE